MAGHIAKTGARRTAQLRPHSPRDELRTYGMVDAVNDVDPPTNAFTLAHLSDPHLTSLRGARVRQFANKRILGYLSWRQRRRYVHRADVLAAVVDDLHGHAPDHIAVTGDLTHVGLPMECRAARDWLEGLGDPQRVSVIPGNHDRYVRDDAASTVGRWRAYACGDDGSDEPPYLRRRGPAAVIGVDSAIPTAPFLAAGEVGAAQRERLARLLQKCAVEGLFRVVLLHHSPLPDGHAHRKRLRDAGPVLEILRDCGTELAIHGHGHIARIDRLSSVAGPLLVISVPSASHAGIGRAGWNSYRISGSVGSWRLDIEARRTTDQGVAKFEQHSVWWSRHAASTAR
jgi:3',5'-cyclic AMP phosphodiesterase CpdA